MPRRFSISAVASAALFAICTISPAAAQKQPASAGKWVTAWGTSQQGLSNSTISNATVRMIARVTIPGDAVRIRLDNTFGTTPVNIGTAYVGLRNQAAQLVKGSNQQAKFNGSASVTIPPMGSVESDPVPLKVMAWQDVAVSLYVPDADVKASQHNGAQVTSYVSANGSGDVGADESRTPFVPPAPAGPGGAARGAGAAAPTTPPGSTVAATYWLKSIDVQTTPKAGAIVAFGDSITDGTCTTLDAHDRWEDWVAMRLALAGADRAVVNEGIGGNTITRENLNPPVNSVPAVERFDRDVLSNSGVSHLILFEGTNDIRRGASAEQVIAGMQDIVTRAKAKGIKVIGATIVPRHDGGNFAPRAGDTGWTEQMSQVRQQVNEWIKTKAHLDAVLDFDKVMRDPASPDSWVAAYNCGDGVHPNPRGYMEMGKSVPLSIFEAKRPAQNASRKPASGTQSKSSAGQP